LYKTILIVRKVQGKGAAAGGHATGQTVDKLAGRNRAGAQGVGTQAMPAALAGEANFKTVSF
jgi:hypothetical protein